MKLKPIAGIIDHAVWTIVVPKGGRYDVWLHWACDNGTAGNSFLLQIADTRVPLSVLLLLPLAEVEMVESHHHQRMADFPGTDQSRNFRDRHEPGDDIFAAIPLHRVL